MASRRATTGQSVIAAAATDAGPQGFRWAIAGIAPPVTAALSVGEATRAAVYATAEKHGLTPLPDWFHAGDDPAHSHARWLSEDADGDGLIDHILLFCEAGLPKGLAPVLAGGADVWLGRLGEFSLVPDWMGRRGAGALFGPAQAWETVTPYVTPRWRTHAGGRCEERPNEAIDQQIVREVGRRHLPPLVALGIGPALPCGQELIAAGNFLSETVSRRPPRDAVAAAARLVFAEPVWGPLTLGFGSHFGLGLFVPADDRSAEGTAL